MSVINFGPEELGNAARFVAPLGDDFVTACRLLAVVSRANVAEFIETYAQRHGTPVAVTEQEIRDGAPGTPARALALDTLGCLDYNTQTNDDVLRLEAALALVSLLTMAVHRLALAEVL